MVQTSTSYTFVTRTFAKQRAVYDLNANANVIQVLLYFLENRSDEYPYPLSADALPVEINAELDPAIASGFIAEYDDDVGSLTPAYVPTQAGINLIEQYLSDQRARLNMQSAKFAEYSRTLPGNSTHKQMLLGIENEWRDCYDSFRAAFDNPLARRKISNEYADDSRERMRQFDQMLKTRFFNEQKDRPPVKAKTEAPQYLYNVFRIPDKEVSLGTVTASTEADALAEVVRLNGNNVWVELRSRLDHSHLR